jgi:predicted GNAT superfamily acetyltransferase
MGTDWTSTELPSPVVGDHEAIVALNNEFSAETSVLNASAMRARIDAAFFVSVAGSMDGFCIALDQAAAYDNPNFNWFRDKLQRFIGRTVRYLMLPLHA